MAKDKEQPIYPKGRSGKECKKSGCFHFQAYSKWTENLGSGHLSFCRECKNAHVSQYWKGKE